MSTLLSLHSCRLTAPAPHFATPGKNYSRRWKDSGFFEALCDHAVRQAIAAGCIDGRMVFTDSPGTSCAPLAWLMPRSECLVSAMAQNLKKLALLESRLLSHAFRA